MLDAASEAVDFAQGATRSSLEADRRLALAIIKDVNPRCGPTSGSPAPPLTLA
jgi:hypothetical protein